MTPFHEYSKPCAVYTHPIWSNPPSPVAHSADGGGTPEVLDTELPGVVKVRRACDRLRGLGQHAHEVTEVVDVPVDLQTRMQHGPVARSVDVEQRVAVAPASCATPLLELEDDVRVATCRGVDPGQDDVRTLARQRQAVLHENLNPAEACLPQVVGEHWQRVSPRPPFTLARPADALVHQEVRKERLDRAGLGQHQQFSGAAAQ